MLETKISFFVNKGSLISKSWIVKNVGWSAWPKDPRLIFDHKIVGLSVPMILDVLSPGDKMVITINFQIPRELDDDKEIHKISLNLNSKKFGNFGEQLILSYKVDDDQFDFQSKSNNDLFDRVKLI